MKRFGPTPRARKWADVPDELWNDATWQFRNRITDVEDLPGIVNISTGELDVMRAVSRKFRLDITPYYASLIDPDDRNCPIWLQAIPDPRELDVWGVDLPDPLDERIDSPVPGITHRYPDRVLFLVTDQCSVECRHCTRRHFTGQKYQAMPTDQIEAGIDYIRRHDEVRDVLVSGGDPGTLGIRRLEPILAALRAIPHVEVIRLGTRIPVVLPQKITPEYCRMLARYHPLYVNTHFNHPKEITAESAAACEMLADHGIPVGNQSVLLAGINDDPKVMLDLVRDLLLIRVKPYYLYQCDLSEGIGHFRTPVEKGIEIIEHLRGHTTGFAVPTFVVDAPGGGGKIPVMPQYLISMGEKQVVLRNFEGTITHYPQPDRDKMTRHRATYTSARKWRTRGVARMLSDPTAAPIPGESDRLLRRGERNLEEFERVMADGELALESEGVERR